MTDHKITTAQKIPITLLLLRHGMTVGNLKKRYIGRTDEALCKEGIEKLCKAAQAGIYPAAQTVFSSPMKRCIQTAKLLYPGKQPEIIEDFRECDFGLFEGKNYLELNGNAAYQQWIDSNGTLPFPKGEAVEAFKQRSVRAFSSVLENLAKRSAAAAAQEHTAVMIVHGGTIMAVLEAFCGGSYYDYHCENGGGYLCTYEPQGKLHIIKVLP